MRCSWFVLPACTQSSTVFFKSSKLLPLNILLSNSGIESLGSYHLSIKVDRINLGIRNRQKISIQILVSPKRLEDWKKNNLVTSQVPACINRIHTRERWGWENVRAVWAGMLGTVPINFEEGNEN